MQDGVLIGRGKKQRVTRGVTHRRTTQQRVEQVAGDAEAACRGLHSGLPIEQRSTGHNYGPVEQRSEVHEVGEQSTREPRRHAASANQS